MTHDIQGLLNLIKELEERIIVLELSNRDSAGSTSPSGNVFPQFETWYWDH